MILLMRTDFVKFSHTKKTQDRRGTEGTGTRASNPEPMQKADKKGTPLPYPGC